MEMRTSILNRSHEPSPCRLAPQHRTEQGGPTDRAVIPRLWRRPEDARAPAQTAPAGAEPTFGLTAISGLNQFLVLELAC